MDRVLQPQPFIQNMPHLVGNGGQVVGRPAADHLGTGLEYAQDLAAGSGITPSTNGHLQLFLEKLPISLRLTAPWADEP